MHTSSNSASSARRPSTPFRLTRFFSLTSLLGIVIVTASLFGVYRELTLRHLVDHESRANAALTRAFANTVWDQYRGFVLKEAKRTREQLIADPAQAIIRADVVEKMNGLQVVKIKIYNQLGQTVFSTDQSQIGQDKSANQGFLSAMAGTVVSHMSYRATFDAFEGSLSDRNVISSYVPVARSPGEPPEGVIEVYSDVTELFAKQIRAQWQIAGTVLTLLGMLYFFLLYIVRKADRIIARQEKERAVQAEEMRHQAYHDALTGLPNRKDFAERLGESVALATRHGHAGALMFIDLDRFKIVNDSLGHQAGDSLLKEVATRIHSCLRGSDLLFRMGGDEFTVILPRVEMPDDAAFVARRILQAVAEPVRIEQSELVSGATIGIAVYPGDGSKTELLLKNADAAMYSAKESGRGTHAFYREDMNRRAHQRLNLEADLRQSFINGEFSLYYQPRLAAATRRVVAVEALLRWINPARGVLLPAEFISVLEDTGMIKDVGEWVLKTACTQVAKWHVSGAESLSVSVNISSIQLQDPSFVGMVDRVLRETGIPAEFVELELTESILVGNADLARTTIESLKALGVRILIDDFGIVYSSLNFLREFAVDYLKIDVSFVSEIQSNERSRAVARSIVELANSLDIIVVAEGVETEAQALFFSEICCGELQGFLFCEPKPVEQLQGDWSASLNATQSSGQSTNERQEAGWQADIEKPQLPLFDRV